MKFENGANELAKLIIRVSQFFKLNRLYLSSAGYIFEQHSISKISTVAPECVRAASASRRDGAALIRTNAAGLSVSIH